MSTPPSGPESRSSCASGPVKAFGYPEFFVPPHHLDRAAARGRPGHARRAPATAGRRDRVRHPRRGAVPRPRRDRRVAGRARGRRPARSGALLAAVDAFVRAEVDGRARGRPDPPGPDERLPADLGPGAHCSSGGGPGTRATRWRSRSGWPTSSVSTSTRGTRWPRRTADPVPGRQPGPGQQRRRERLLDWAAAAGRRLMIAEGQAEPWEAVTTPPSPAGRAMYSCRPEHLIENYSQCMRWTDRRPFVLDAYLFWGAEYWLLRERQGRSALPARVRARAGAGLISGFAPGSRTPPPR